MAIPYASKGLRFVDQVSTIIDSIINLLNTIIFMRVPSSFNSDMWYDANLPMVTMVLRYVTHASTITMAALMLVVYICQAILGTYDAIWQFTLRSLPNLLTQFVTGSLTSHLAYDYVQGLAM